MEMTTACTWVFQVKNASSSESFSMAVDELGDIVDISGCGCLLRFEKKESLVKALTKFIVFERLQPASNQ